VVLGPPKAVLGRSLPTMVVDAGWHTFHSSGLHLTVQYPATWRAVGDPNDNRVRLYPPEVGQNEPGANIAIAFLPNTAYGPQPLISDNITTPQEITVARISGREYEDSVFVAPNQSSYIELPYHSGMLLITTTIGPSLDLTAQRDQVLRTFVTE